jgi:hypothetical protein
MKCSRARNHGITLYEEAPFSTVFNILELLTWALFKKFLHAILLQEYVFLTFHDGASQVHNNLPTQMSLVKSLNSFR